MSIVNRRIDEVIRGALAAVLKQYGFRKDGRTFRRWEGHLCLIVNIQASHGNSGNDGKFYVNLAVYRSDLHPPADISVLEKPKEFHGQRRARLEKGPEASDGWWEIRAETSTSELSSEVAALLEKRGLPWLLSQAAEFSSEPPALR